MLAEYFADLHVHLGWSGQPGGGVKISAARDLTLAGILAECRQRKGIQVVGVIDASTAGALADLERLLADGSVWEREGGGFAFGEDLTLIPGAEVEVLHPLNGASRRPLHLLCYFRGARELRGFSAWQSGLVKNRQLSTQRHHGVSASDVVTQVAALGGFVVPAHIFTPYKSLYSAAPKLADVIDPNLWEAVPAVELGLSSDTALADELHELQGFTFVSNSDAHSLGKIAREYNRIQMASPTFDELLRALREEGGRRILANYGLDPRLGKYHRTYCLTCERRVEGDPPVLLCPGGVSHRLVLGVLDRIRLFGGIGPSGSDAPGTAGRDRPDYIHQIPLQFVPGLGRKGLERLLEAFGTEMSVLHSAGQDDLKEVVGERTAALVVAARAGRLTLEEGAGGFYGRIVAE